MLLYCRNLLIYSEVFCDTDRFFLFNGRLVLDVFPSPAQFLFCFLMCIHSQILNTHDCFHCGVAEA